MLYDGSDYMPGCVLEIEELSKLKEAMIHQTHFHMTW